MKKDTAKLKQLQRMAIKIIKYMGQLVYEKQLTRLEIISLKKGSIRVTMIYVYKIINIRDKAYRDEVFVVSSVKN